MLSTPQAPAVSRKRPLVCSPAVALGLLVSSFAVASGEGRPRARRRAQPVVQRVARVHARRRRSSPTTAPTAPASPTSPTTAAARSTAAARKPAAPRRATSPASAPATWPTAARSSSPPTAAPRSAASSRRNDEGRAVHDERHRRRHRPERRPGRRQERRRDHEGRRTTNAVATAQAPSRRDVVRRRRRRRHAGRQARRDRGGPQRGGHLHGDLRQRHLGVRDRRPRSRRRPTPAPSATVLAADKKTVAVVTNNRRAPRPTGRST